MDNPKANPNFKSTTSLLNSSTKHNLDRINKIFHSKFNQS